MIVHRFIRAFAGTVRFATGNGLCERLINLCAENNVSLWDFHKTEDGFSAVCTAKDYKKICSFAERVNVEVTVLQKKGILFRLGKYSRRWGLFVGIVLFLLFLLLSQCFVWEIEVSGNTTVPTSVILNELEDIGVKKWSFIPGLDLLLKKQEALLKLPQLSWLAINKNGCRLIVSVTERKLPPTIREDTPCNIVAAQTGQIRYMEVYRGKKMVEENYTVQKGQILVSGEYETDLGDPILVHADAKIIAEVQFDKTLSLDIEQLSKRYTGQEKKRYYLNLFSLRIPLFIATPIQGDYDAVLQQNPICLFNRELPIGIDSIHYRFYEKEPDAMTTEQAEEVLTNSFRQYEATELKGSVILSRTVQTAQTDGVFSMTVSYIAEQDIAKKVKLAGKETALWTWE